MLNHRLGVTQTHHVQKQGYRAHYRLDQGLEHSHYHPYDGVDRSSDLGVGGAHRDFQCGIRHVVH